MTVTTDTVPVRQAKSPLRFSLRLLLLAVTVFAIGFPIWYRWPYEEVDDKQSANPDLRSTTTWQREWGGGRSKIARSKYFQGSRIRLETFRGETRHGPYEISSRDGSREVGQFVDGKKDGLWQIFDSQGKKTESISWRLGRLDGEMTRVGGEGSAREWTFAGGRLLTIDGRSAESYWPAVAAAKRNVPPELRAALHEDAIRPNFKGTPLRDVVAFLAPSRETLVLIDRQHVDETKPITIDCEGTDLYSCLTMIAQEYGLACDVRYGAVWFTSPESALHWQDKTGVEALIPRFKFSRFSPNNLRSTSTRRRWNPSRRRMPIASS
jgi:hypothetical protein